MTLKVYDFCKLEGQAGGCSEILRKLLGECFSNFTSQTKAHPGEGPRCTMHPAGVLAHADREGSGKMQQGREGGASTSPRKLTDRTAALQTQKRWLLIFWQGKE